MTVTRRRAGGALALVAALALAAGLVCARDGNGGPRDAAARLVPADALAYVHLSTDPERAPDRRLGQLAGALPAVGRLRAQLAAAVAPTAIDFDRDVRPWLGDELAYAALSPADSLVLAAVADRRRAEALVARVGNFAGAERHRDVLLLLAGPTALAFVGDFLAVGTEAAVRAAIDREQGNGARLADLPAYRRIAEAHPDGRSLDAYATAGGVRLLLTPRAGLSGALGALLERPGLTAAGASVSAEEDGLLASVRLAGGAARDAAFAPVLLERVPEDAVAYLGLRGGLRFARLLERLGAAGPVSAVRAALSAEAGVDLDRDLLAPLSDELAFAVTGPAAGAGAPVLTLKARTADPPGTEDALARSQAPLAQRLTDSSPSAASGTGAPMQGTVPAFEPATIGGLPAHTLRVTPELAPSYAVAGGSVVLSTAPAGLEPPRGTLAAAEGFETTIGPVPDRAESLGFVDLRRLLALGEQTGLTAIPGLATARDDLRRVGAAGIVVTQDPAHPSDTIAELFATIS